LNRREFIQAASSVVALSVVQARAGSRGVSLVIDLADPVAAAGPAQWAAKELKQSLTGAGIAVQRHERVTQATRENICIVAADSKSKVAASVLKASHAKVAAVPEALGLVPGRVGDRKVLLACGNDARGLVYALLDLTDRVKNASDQPDPLAALAITKPIIEQPSNKVRSLMRLFASEVEDKPWYNDREMWPQYLTMLATQRFNRFNLGLGLGYDFLRQVTDAYFLFAYPFLLSVPGYNVRVPQLPDAERDRNLAALKFISEQTVARGLEFQLGIWTHGYEWANSPRANYTIEGLTKETQAAYARDAIRLLLQSCPAISGVTIRTHGESGVEEGSYDFWRTVFEGVASCGRKVEIDLHTKGLDQSMLDVALATRQPIRVSPKYWAEHLGLPYHQTDIREIEAKAGEQFGGLLKISQGSRNFLRYGYGDLLCEDRRWSVSHRVWPGSQRLLLWGDPSTGAAYSRAFGFCGSDGAEIMEPLTFKGRRGSGIAGDRCGYDDKRLRPRWDWQKYLYTYRVWGRLLYNPDSDPDTWRRYLRHHFGDAAPEVESALANASRILPIVTTSHLPSAANNNYWPEIYLNHSLFDAEHPGSYGDTPAPRVFGNVSPLDPQLFSRINNFADELLKIQSGQSGFGGRSGKYSPIEVAQWIDDYAAAATRHLDQAALRTRNKEHAEYSRMAIDVGIQAGLGHFFAAKFRAAVLYRIFEQTNDRSALESSLDQYRKARAAWADLAKLAQGVYVSDITIGELPQLRGHWLDRLPAIDRDIAGLAAKLDASERSEPSAPAALAIKEVLEHPHHSAFACHHQSPAHFVAGQPLTLDLSLARSPDRSEAANLVSMYYRHVNQAERFNIAKMEPQEHRYRATIPGTYTDSAYPLQYYFEVRSTPDRAFLYPGLSENLMNQPYFVVRRAGRVVS
jgi:hypothetical protein